MDTEMQTYTKAFAELETYCDANEDFCEYTPEVWNMFYSLLMAAQTCANKLSSEERATLGQTL